MEKTPLAIRVYGRDTNTDKFVCQGKKIMLYIPFKFNFNFTEV
jgi:hypothetical protein